MSLDVNTTASRIKERLDKMNKKSAAALCEELILSLYGSDDAFPSAEGEKILQYLRNKRMFTQMQRVADALIQTGRDTFTIQRQHAQSLIDQGNYTAALAVLNQLIAETGKADNKNAKAAKENMELRGLLGRVYKQLYVNANNNSVRKADFIRRAIDAYEAVYNAAPGTALWHGINVVALVQRAKSDGIEDPAWPNDQELAQSILTLIQQRYDDREATIWQFATACEACVALQKPKEAMHWLSGYLRMPNVDAFEVASMLRQMKEIWRLNMHSEMGQMILPLLQAELLVRGKKPREAMAVYDRALGNLPDDRRLLYARALLAVDQGNQAAGERDLRRILELAPDDAEALNALGYTLADGSRRGDPAQEEALRLIGRALELKPDEPAIVDSMGWLQYRMGNLDQALADLRRAYASEPDPDIAAHLGEVLWVRGEHDEARRIWDAARSKAPDNKTLIEAIRRLTP